jgi:hypothetical protein
MIECPNHRPPGFYIFELTVLVTPEETIYRGKCKACGFAPWDKQTIEWFKARGYQDTECLDPEQPHNEEQEDEL